MSELGTALAAALAHLAEGDGDLDARWAEAKARHLAGHSGTDLDDAGVPPALRAFVARLVDPDQAPPTELGMYLRALGTTAKNLGVDPIAVDDHLAAALRDARVV